MKKNYIYKMKKGDGRVVLLKWHKSLHNVLSSRLILYHLTPKKSAELRSMLLAMLKEKIYFDIKAIV